MPLYDAFISYSHAKDKTVATALQNAMQRLGKPWYRRRALRVFRDDTSLSATPHLWPSIEEALSASRYFILLASLEAARSKWVNKEVSYWLEHKGVETLLIGLCDGELSWDEATSAFTSVEPGALPPALQRQLPTEPKWIDLRPYRARAQARDSKFIELAADFAAAVRGMPKEDLLSEEVRQQREAVRLALGAVGSLLVLAVVAAWQWNAAVVSERLAQSQRDRAVTAERAAVEREREAQAQRDRTLLAQSRFLAETASRHTLANEPVAGALLALEALPDKTAGVTRPYSPDAEAALLNGYLQRQELTLLKGHSAYVTSAQFSPDGKRILTSSWDGTARIWDAASGRELVRLMPAARTVDSAAYSPDGQRIVTVAKGLEIWDSQSGKRISSFPQLGSGGAAAFSPDGRRIVTGVGADRIAVIDVEQGREILSLRGHTALILSAVFTADGRRIASVAQDNTIRFWDAETGAAGPVFKTTLTTPTVSADGRLVVTGEGNTAAVWDIETGSKLEVLQGHDAGIDSASFSPDGRRIVTTARDRTARVWDSQTGNLLFVLKGHLDWVRGASFSPDGRRIVTASRDGTARIWSTDGAPEAQVLAVPDGRAMSVSFSADGHRLLSSGRRARVWDVETGNALLTVDNPRDFLRAALSRDAGKLLIVSYNVSTAKDDESSIEVWDIKTGEVVFKLLGHTTPTAALSLDGKLLVAGFGGEPTELWQVDTGTRLGEIAPRGLDASRAEFSPDGQRLAIVHFRNIRIWDVVQRKLVVSLQPPELFLNLASFTPDGKQLLSAGDGIARLWDAATGRQLFELPGTLGKAAVGISFSPDSRRAILVSEDNTARIFDLETGRLLVVLKHGVAGSLLTLEGIKLPEANATIGGTPILSARFSPNGRQIVTASKDGTVRIWDAASGAQTGMLVLDPLLSDATFNPDGTRLATASTDVRIWPMFRDAQDLVDEAKAKLPRCLTRTEREQAFLAPEPPAWCIDNEKWPYHGAAYKVWLCYNKAGARPPLPDTPQWKTWQPRQDNQVMQALLKLQCDPPFSLGPNGH